MTTAVSARSFTSDRAALFTESVIREMTRLALRHNAVNLSQGFPDFPSPVDLKQAAMAAIDADYNQYAITWGAKPFRDAIVSRYKRHYGLELDPEREVTVTCGATEGMVASLLATTNPGDEIIVFEPFYENYHPDGIICGATSQMVELRAPDWTFDRDELRRAFNSRTKAIVINTPNNPTGKVFTRDEMMFIAELCQEFDVLAITDEIYEYIIYDGEEHVLMADLPGMRERTITINSMSKTFSVTGWRVGWVIAPPTISNNVRKVHDFLTVGAAAPLQQAGVMALNLPDAYFQGLSAEYDARRQYAVRMLQKAGFACKAPKGAYYIMTDISAFGAKNDVEFSRFLVTEIGVATVPGSSFYQNPADGAKQVRFCYCKTFETLAAANERLSKLTRG
jgi:aminotransferase